MKRCPLARYTLHVLLSFMLMLAIFLLLPNVAAASSRVEQHNTGVHGRKDNQGAVTILVLDMSGSMAQSDPDGLRCSAANAFIDLSGPGNYIGLVALDGAGQTGGAHNFQLAQTWADPTEMATPQQRQALQQTLKEKSRNCQPHSSTPTYDALARAAHMLQQSTQGGALTGSVVLLTDGVPDPNTSEQINAIQHDLLPTFKQQGWPIDTVALGNDAALGAGTAFHSFHDFLSGIASATSGKFYDDARGVIQGQPSPLNIAPFFVDIFARHNHRTVGDDIGVTQLEHRTISRAFNVTGYTDSLNVVVIKDDPATKVTLQDPAGRSVDNQSGVFVANSDPHYVIYAIERPSQGSWSLSVNGSGHFLMKSLKVASLGIADLAISQAGLQSTPGSALAIGQPITVTTQPAYHGTPVTDNSIVLNGSVMYSGGSATYGQEFTLSTQGNPGSYSGTFVIPENAPAGSYDIAVNAYSVSLQNPIASQLRSVRIEHFPEPLLMPAGSQQPTDQIVEASAVQWDPVLRTIYSVPLAPVQWLSKWPLQDSTTPPTTDLAGETVLNQQPYDGAQLHAQVLVPGEQAAQPVQVTNDQHGRFHIAYAAPQGGLYAVNFHTSGNFAESHGDFGTIQRLVHVTLRPASLTQTLFAWLVTLLYLLALVLLVLLIRSLLLPHPFGGAMVSQGGETVGNILFKRARRGPLQWLLKPDQLQSRQAGMPAGLGLRFKRGGGIEARREQAGGQNWQQGDGERLPSAYQEVSEVRYRPGVSEEDAEPVNYQLSSQLPDSFESNDIDEDMPRTARKEKRRKHDDSATNFDWQDW